MSLAEVIVGSQLSSRRTSSRMELSVLACVVVATAFPFHMNLDAMSEPALPYYGRRNASLPTTLPLTIRSKDFLAITAVGYRTWPEFYERPRDGFSLVA